VVPWLDRLDRSMSRGAASSSAASSGAGSSDAASSNAGSSRAGSHGPHAAVAAQLLVDNEAEIRRLITRYRTLVAQCLSDHGPLVITHGEIHPGNVMVTSKGWVIVDWDTALVAPPERDLWRLAQGDGSVLGEYANATGTTPDERLLDLYTIRWDLAEVASFAAHFRKPHEDTDDSRKALELLRSVVGRLRT
jgi:spectinomycin phosphotransferase/16S rRNA (guanine(1405)-N(7))-methyltransferase